MSERNLLNEDHWAAIADDYETLPSQEFDAKYPGWANSLVFDRELRAEFQRRRPAPPLNEGPRPREVSDE